MSKPRDIHQELADAAWDLACQRATEEGDVDIDYDYPLMEQWTSEYYLELCKEEGIEPDPNYYVEE
jgi:hypothetical protein